MKTKYFCLLIPVGIILSSLISCKDDDEKPACDTFTPADSLCYCQSNPDDAACNTFTSFSISLYTDEVVALTPHPTNGTLWCRGFVIDRAIYVIDRESSSPQAFWKFDVDKNDVWEKPANFPGVQYGLTGSANGKGYASSYASNKFWEYNPASNEWTPLTDLPFSPADTHWVEYKDKFYVPYYNGIYEFTASSKQWSKISDQTSSGFGALFLLGDDMYWYDINSDYMNRYNLADKSFETHDLPDNFNGSTVFNSPFVLDQTAYVVSRDVLWVFDKDSRTWARDEEAIKEGSSYPDDAFVMDGKEVYLIDNGSLKVFEGVPE